MSAIHSNIRIGSYKIAGILILFNLLLALSVIGCSGGDKDSLETPQGVVNNFIDRILDDGDLKAAFELLSEEDRKVIISDQQIHDFIQGKAPAEFEEHSDLLNQMLPDLLAMVQKLIKINARKGNIKDGYTEVGLEISYPSDYMTLSFIGMGIYNNAMQKLQGVNLEELTKEEREKIIWSIKNDLEKAVESINTDKYSTYIFPVKVVDENGVWRINLGLSSPDKMFNF
jgi:hypothetical protein